MKRNNLHVGLMAFAMLLIGASCSDDDNTLSYSTGAVQNTELKTILVQRGYTFNEDGNLLLDDLANNTTTLDLSGTQISTDALAELSMFPNLTDVDLSDNGYGPAFDFAKLPEQITGIDLTGNEIYDYDNLVSVVVEENGDETVTNLHEITKLYLPETAKENIEDLVRFYRQNKEAITAGTIDMKMTDVDGNLQTYTTLRDVPDANLLTYLQTNFSDLFNGDQIDLSKHLGLDQKTKELLVAPADNVTNFEGIQFLVENPYWEGAKISLYSAGEESIASMPNIKVGKFITQVILQNIEVEDIDLSNATDLRSAWVQNNPALQKLDLSYSTIWGQGDKETEGNGTYGSSLMVLGCPILKEIKLPEKNELKAYRIDIECLDALETFDMSNVKMVAELSIGDLNKDFNLVYPELTIFYSEDGYAGTYFACSENTFYRESTQAFLKANYTDIDPDDTVRRLGYTSSLSYDKNKGCRWRTLLNKQK